MEKIMDNTILCVKWGDKYGREYVEKLKEQCEKNCSVPFNFYCLTDKPTEPYDLFLPVLIGMIMRVNIVVIEMNKLHQTCGRIENSTCLS